MTTSIHQTGHNLAQTAPSSTLSRQPQDSLGQPVALSEQAPEVQELAPSPPDKVKLSALAQRPISISVLGPALGFSGAAAILMSPLVSKSPVGLALSSTGLATISGALSGSLIQDRPLALAIGGASGFVMGGALGSHKGLASMVLGAAIGTAVGLTSSATIHSLRHGN